MWNTRICKFVRPYPYYACTYAPVSNTYVSMPLHPPSKSEIKELRTCSAFLLNDFSRKQLSEGVTNCAIKTALNISLRTFPPCSTLTMSLQLVIKKRLRSTVRVIIKFPPNTRIRVRASNKCTNGHPRQTGTGVQQILKGASDRTGTEHAMIIGSCQKCWRIPANATYVIPANDTCKWRAFKSNKSAYKGVQLRISTKEFDRERISISLALRATQEEAGWFTLQANCL